MAKSKLIRDDSQPAGSQQSYEEEGLGAVLTAGNDAGDQQIIGLADPVEPQDAATKAYVDGEGTPTLQSVLAAGQSVNGEDGEDGPGNDIVAKAAGVVRASVGLSKTGQAAFSVKDASGVEVATLNISANEFQIGLAGGAVGVSVLSGNLNVFTAGGTIALDASGNIALTGTTFTYNGDDVAVVP